METDGGRWNSRILELEFSIGRPSVEAPASCRPAPSPKIQHGISYIYIYILVRSGGDGGGKSWSPAAQAQTAPAGLNAKTVQSQ